jgi:hypothetical protein
MNCAQSPRTGRKKQKGHLAMAQVPTLPPMIPTVSFRRCVSAVIRRVIINDTGSRRDPGRDPAAPVSSLS